MSNTVHSFAPFSFTRNFVKTPKNSVDFDNDNFFTWEMQSDETVWKSKKLVFLWFLALNYHQWSCSLFYLTSLLNIFVLNYFWVFAVELVDHLTKWYCLVPQELQGTLNCDGQLLAFVFYNWPTQRKSNRSVNRKKK